VLSRAITPKRKGRNWLTALATLSLLTGTFVTGSTVAGLSQSVFELDKNATNDLTTTHLGVIKSSLNATATSITVCERADVTYPAAPFTILIDAEQMTVTGFGATSTSTGGCSFSDPAVVKSGTRVYNLTRAVNGTTAASHPGDSDVTLMVTGAAAGDDWDQVYQQVTADTNDEGDDDKCVALGAVECLWVHDDFNVSVFTTGGSKDDLNVNPDATLNEPGTGWKWTDSSVPPSDEILDAFAAKYDTGTSQLLFFGADRWSTNGAKDMGFWFFHDQIGLNADGTFSGNHTRPTDPDGTPGTGDETRGDILLLSTFTQGGAVTSIRVFEWVGTGGNTNGTLNSIGAFGDCVPGNVSDSGCNTVNNTTVPSPWPYQGAGSSQVANTFYSGALAEGGIDLTELGLEGCFSSFMAETRSSPEPGAQLKDFALGNFEACGATITTDASDDSFAIGGSITDNATVNITGGGPAPTGFVDFYVCGPSAGISSCDATGTFLSSEDLATAVVSGTDYTVTSDSFTPTEAGDYCFYAEYPAGQDPNYPDGAFLTDFSDECFTVTPNQPTISTVATSATADPLGTAIDDTATLGNTATPSNGLHGTITFTAYGPHDNTTTCTTVAYTSVIDVTGDGSYTASDGDADGDDVPGEVPDDQFIPTVAGTYNWIAVYAPDAGDVNNLGVSGACGDANEGSVIGPNQPTISTQVDDAGPVPLGTAIDDTATLGNTATPSNGLHGTITFTAYGPHDNTTTCTTVAYTSVVNVTGDGDYTASDGTGGAFTPTEAGTYNWIAVYAPDAGDVNNLGVSGACGDANEGTVVISIQPTISTAQSFFPQDEATVSVASGGGDLDGTLDIQLFDNNTCTGTPLYEELDLTIADSTGSDGLTRTWKTDNTTFEVSADASLWWKVSFDNDNPAHKDVVSDCVENSSITIDNGS
jgi:hypothetical protein